MAAPFRVGFVTGATPDKWAARWREQSRVPLELVPLTEAEQEPAVRSGRVDVVLARLPVDREGLHCVRLYDEQPVAVVGREHVLTLLDDVTLDDLAEEQLVLPHPSGWRPAAPQLDWPAMSVAEAVEVVASGSGVAIVPMSLARLHHRRDVTHRVVTDLDPTTVALVWPVDRDTDHAQLFVAITRGRTARSSRPAR